MTEEERAEAIRSLKSLIEWQLAHREMSLQAAEGFAGSVNINRNTKRMEEAKKWLQLVAELEGK